MLAQGRVVTGDAGENVAGGERVAVLPLQAEDVAVPAVEQVQAVGFQDLGHVGSRFALPFRAGFAAFKGGGSEVADMLLHRGHGFAVLQRPVGRAELGGGEQGQEERQGGQDPSHGYSILRMQASFGQKDSLRSFSSAAHTSPKSLVGQTATVVMPLANGRSVTG